MKVAQVKKYYSGKENAPCPLTDKLIAAGYRQVGGGYIDRARKMGIVSPSQYWHLMSYCDSVDDVGWVRNMSINCRLMKKTLQNFLMRLALRTNQTVKNFLH